MTPRTRSPTRDHMEPAHRSLAAKERDNGSLKIWNMFYDCDGIARLINLTKHKTICAFSIIFIGPALAQFCLITPYIMGGWHTYVCMCMLMHIYVCVSLCLCMYEEFLGSSVMHAHLNWVLKQWYALCALLCYEFSIWLDCCVLPIAHSIYCIVSVEIKLS